MRAARAGRGWRRGLAGLASLRLTAGLLLVLMVILVLGAQELVESEWPRVALLFALALNLVATVARRWKGFLRKPGLLGFHLALIGLCGVAGAGRLVHQECELLLIEGQERGLAATVRSRGPLAPGWLQEAGVRLERYQVEYHRSGTQLAAEARLQVNEEGGAVRSIVLRPGQGVSVSGVRYSLWPNAGFAALFSLTTPSGARSQGAITFPEYRRKPLEQVQVLNLPGGSGAISAELELPDLRGEGERWRLEAPPEARVALILPGATEPWRLAVGQALELPLGTLRLEALPTYARLSAPYDPVWPVVVTLLAALPFFLLWHYLWTMRGRKKGRSPA
ncbi:MAG: cytochrome c biogenesis protein ResB [Deltaproteobacteria bacterium]|nr:cytochrome c biogenesis protein ResB [Deltaproteobacteria bacterium]